MGKRLGGSQRSRNSRDSRDRSHRVFWVEVKIRIIAGEIGEQKSARTPFQSHIMDREPLGRPCDEVSVGVRSAAFPSSQARARFDRLKERPGQDAAGRFLACRLIRRG